MDIEQSPRLSLGSDNHSGVHPKIWAAMARVNADHAPSYGNDSFSEKVISQMRKQLGETAQIQFVFNGTGANVLCLASLVRSFQSVICAETAHLHLDEAGAPEKIVGCKVLALPTTDGKIHPEQVQKFLIRGGDQHYAQPRLVSLTQPTEYGTVYSLEELRHWREFTSKNNLLLHIDGARLIYAANYLNCSLYDLTEGLGIDALSLGGTKNGMLFGEAVVLYDKSVATTFKNIRKQNLQLPSKMRFLSAQFDELINNNLWREITDHGHKLAVNLAERLAAIKEVKVTQKVQANSVFAIVPKSWIKPLRQHVFFYVWDEESFEVRLMISYDVTPNDIETFVGLLKDLSHRGV